MDGSDVGRATLTYRSADFTNWSDCKAFSLARVGQLASTPIEGQQGHMGAGLWNRGNVIIGLNGLWQDAPKKPEDGRYWNAGVRIDLGLVLSNNGIHFREPIPDHKVIARGEPGEWDDVALLQGHAFVNEGDQTMMWYSHWDTGGKLKNMEIGLATLRRDGFGYMSRRVPDSPAHFETAHFKATERVKLYANVDGLSVRAPLKIELHDSLNRPLPEFSGQHAAILSESGTRRWAEFSKPIPLNQDLAIRVTFPTGADAKVYALYVSKE